jgi:protein arginine N-methyltransferase 2
MSDFHDALPSMLYPGGVYSFFNGMCPFNLFFHGVRTYRPTLQIVVNEPMKS